MTLASDRRAALQFCQRRGFLGAELPCGIPKDAYHCPVGEALGGAVDAALDGTWVLVDGERAHAVAVARFIRNFDAGKYPDLIDESAPAPG